MMTEKERYIDKRLMEWAKAQPGIIKERDVERMERKFKAEYKRAKMAGIPLIPTGTEKLN